jgi:2-amino-4-hydroxy-6-hydroxymethyldihydropteridine diphosphokinase
METAYLLLGSNLGDRAANLNLAVRRLSAVMPLISQSSIFSTKPWGKTDQPDFLNQAAAFQSGFPAIKLLSEILTIEIDMGRARQEHWGPRLIDIDILLFGSAVIEHPRLKVPHPELVNRKFALLPLAEIAGDVIHPLTKLTIQEQLKICTDPLEVLLWRSR